MVRNWKKRWFVLDMGVLKYFESDGKGKSKGHGHNLKREFYVNDIIIEAKGDLRLYLSPRVGSFDLLMEAPDVETRDGWLLDLQRHANYVQENDLVSVDNRSSMLLLQKMKLAKLSTPTLKPKTWWPFR